MQLLSPPQKYIFSIEEIDELNLPFPPMVANKAALRLFFSP